MNNKTLKPITQSLLLLCGVSTAQALQVKSGTLTKAHPDSQCQGLVLSDLPPPHAIDFYSHQQICVDSRNFEEAQSDELNNRNVKLTGYFQHGTLKLVRQAEPLECAGQCDSSCLHSRNPLHECVQVQDGAHGCRNVCHRMPW